MKKIQYRQAILDDVPALAKLRTQGWGEENYWIERITGYLKGEHHPQQALMPRIAFAATDVDMIVGFVAGHLTKRFDCDGELEWIDVEPAYRRMRIASSLVKILACWFIDQQAYKICVDPGNPEARSFYSFLGAGSLNQHWMVWTDIRHLSE